MKKARLVAIFALFSIIVLGFNSQAFCEKIINVGIKSADMGILDPHLSATTANLPIMDSIFNGLVRFKPGTVDLEQIEPDLAVRWTSSPDKKEWIFYLRKGVHFHHGFGEMTAEDVVFSLKKASAKETSRWWSNYKAFDQVVAVDRYTVKITLKYNVPSMLGLVLNFHGGMVLSKKAYEQYGDDFKLKPVGTGPFAFEEYIPKQKTVLKANDQYWRGRPKIDKIVYHFVPVSNSREMAFLKGELDVIEGIKAEWWAEKMRAKKDVIFDALGPGECTVVHVNMTRKPLDKLKVRQAMAYALNRKDFRLTYGMSITEDAVSPVPPGYLGFTSDVEKYKFNLKKCYS